MTGIPRFEAYESELRKEHGAPSTDIITVSGLVGTGTTTIASFLAESFGMERYDAGHWFRQQAQEYGMNIHEFDKKVPDIEETEGIDFDLEWDRTALEYAFTKDNFVLEGRLAGPLLLNIAPVRVWVHCDADTVAERLISHDESRGNRPADQKQMTVAEAKAYARERNQKVMARYSEKYGIDPTEERFYNVFIDNSQPLASVKKKLLTAVNEHC